MARIMSRRWHKVATAIIGVVIVAIAFVLILFTQTDYGRRRFRTIGLNQLAGMVHGIVTFGTVHGNLLSGATIENVLITDSAGHPFLRADSLSLRYALRSLLRKHIVLQDVRLVRPVVTLEQPPGGKWNFQRLFPGDSAKAAQDSTDGWGDWLRIEGLTLVDGTVLVRRSWKPPSWLNPREREAAIKLALSPDGRDDVVRADSGFQALASFRRVNGYMPLVIWADPDSSGRMIDINRLSMIAQPYRPPVADVRDLSGRVAIGRDTVVFQNLKVTMPASKLAVTGWYSMVTSSANARIHAEPATFADLRFVYPALPDGNGRLDLSVGRVRDLTRLVFTNMDVRAEGAHVTGSIDVQKGRVQHINGSDLAFEGVDTRLIEKSAPQFDLPFEGVLDGRLKLAGTPERLNVEGLANIRDRRGEVSRIVADGGIGNRGAGIYASDLHLRFDPVRMSLVHTVRPDLPIGGVLTGSATLNGNLTGRFNIDADVVHSDVTTGRSRIVAAGDVSAQGGFAMRGLRLRFEPVQAALLRAFQPDIKLNGVLTGRATLTGAMRSGFQIDADITHNDDATGRSHVLAVGRVETANGFVARNLKLRFEPLQVALLRTFAPTLPVDGVITGRATVNGSKRGRLTADFDVTHDGSTGTSTVAGNADLAFAGAAGVLQHIDLDMRARPIALATAGLFAPAAGLRGSATGTIKASGNRDNIRFTTDLDIASGGSIVATGSVALGTAMRYDVRSALLDFDPAAISNRAPTAKLSGTANIAGVGTDPATANATVDVALFDSRMAGAPRLDSTRLVARFANGLASVEQGRIRLASATADIAGSFGLVASQTGTLRYTIATDSLSRVAAFAKGDTSVVYPRPLQQAQRVTQARADSARMALETEVERAATGKPPAPVLRVDSITPLRRDSVAGAVRAEGTVTGNIERFDAKGTATLHDILFRGKEVRSGSVAYNVTGAPGTDMGAELNANLRGVRTNGFGFDSAHVILNKTGGLREGPGSFDLALFQDPSRDYRVKSDFMLALDRKELRLNDLLLRFDSTVWHGTQPGTVSWAASDIALRTIELRNERGGHIFADGTVPDEGSGDLRLLIDSLQVGDIAALLQDTLNTRGIVSIDTRVQGSLRAPIISGTFTMDSATRGGIRLPDLRSTFAYRDMELTADAKLAAGVRQLVDAKVKLPVDLAFSRTVTTPRLLDLPLSIDAHMDSLPLDAMPSLTPAVQDVKGVVRGDIGVRGTIHHAKLTGKVLLELGSMRIVEPGIVLTDAVASLTMNGDKVSVDSLVAKSASGPIRATGTLDVATLTRPGFDLEITAANALVLNNHLGNITANAEIAVNGPYNDVRVVGTIAVIDGVINAPEVNQTRRATDLDDPTLANVFDTLNAPLGVRGGRNPILKNMQMDVLVTIERDTWVRNSTMNVEIYTPDDVDPLHVRVDNAKRAITLEGTINADRGEYTVAGRQFKLSTGSVTFLGAADVDPLLQLSAQYEVPRRNREALAILINIGGYMRAPRLTLSSNAQPPLPQSDLISYLAFGRASSSLLATEGSGIGGGGLGFIAQQQLAGLGLGALTDALVRGFEDEGNKVGLDVFRIHPGVLPDELNFSGYFQNVFRSTQIEAGEYLTPKLFAAVEGRASGTLPGLRLEYETQNGFSWRATWEPRYRPSQPSLTEVQATQKRVFGSFFFFTRRF
ncbi:MAG: translocation/assembly module TamB domain-containing protein [Longimicrobiales bacterium]